MRDSHGGQGLFALSDDPVSLPLEDGSLSYFPCFFSEAEADALFDDCLHSLAWRQDSLRIADRLIPIPRLQCWYGDTGTDYSYSRLKLIPLPWTDLLQGIRSRVEACSEHAFNAVLANCYRDGRDSVDWHSDDEPELGRQPVIASLSLGAARCFELKHRSKRHLKPLKLTLAHGSLLIMRADTQHHWRHRLPKDPTITAPRINLTFRQITPRGGA